MVPRRRVGWALGGAGVLGLAIWWLSAPYEPAPSAPGIAPGGAPTPAPRPVVAVPSPSPRKPLEPSGRSGGVPEEEPSVWGESVRGRATRAAESCGLHLVATSCPGAERCVTVWRGIGQGQLRRCAAWEAPVDPDFAYLRLWVVGEGGEPERLLVFADFPAGAFASGGGPYSDGMGDALADAAARAMEQEGLRIRTPDEVLDTELGRVLELADGDEEHPAVQAVLQQWAPYLER